MLHSADGTILIRAVSHPSSHFDVPGLVQTRRGDSRKDITFPLSRRPTNNCVMVVVVSGGGCDGCGVRGKFSGGGGDVVVVMAVIVDVVVVVVAITQG